MKKGFSLLEVVIFIAILGIFFVTIIGSAVLYLRATKYNEYKILGGRYAQEAMEWIKGEKEADWYDFTTNRTTAAGRTWCFDDPAIGWPNAGSPNFNTAGSCPGFDLGGTFKREVTLTNQDPATNNQVNIQIQVSWLEGEVTRTLTINSIMTSTE